MARSRKKTYGPTRNPRTHREWKSISNRRMRRYAKRQDLLQDEDYLFPTLIEISDIWCSPRDGIGNYPEETLQNLKSESAQGWGDIVCWYKWVFK